MNETSPQTRPNWFSRQIDRFTIGANWSLLISAGIIWAAILITYSR